MAEFEERDDFNVAEVSEEDTEILEELEKEQVMTDIEMLLVDDSEKDFCVSCANNGNCFLIKTINEQLKIRNGIFKAEQIPPIEDRWGCTSHKKLITPPLDNVEV